MLALLPGSAVFPVAGISSQPGIVRKRLTVPDVELPRVLPKPAAERQSCRSQRNGAAKVRDRAQTELPALTRKTGPPGSRTLPGKWVLQGGWFAKLLPVDPQGRPILLHYPGRAPPKMCRRGTARVSRIAHTPAQVNNFAQSRLSSIASESATFPVLRKRLAALKERFFQPCRARESG